MLASFFCECASLSVNCFVFNPAALKEGEYYDTWFYFLGQVPLMIPWPHWEFGHCWYSGGQIEGIPGEVYAWTRDQELVNIPFEHLEASRGKNYPHDCRSLALSKVPELKSKAIQKLDLVLSSLGIIELWSSSRATPSNWTMVLMILVKVCLEEDPTNTCREYPADFSTCAQRDQETFCPETLCPRTYIVPGQYDDQFVRNFLPNKTPIWFVAQHCIGVLQLLQIALDFFLTWKIFWQISERKCYKNFEPNGIYFRIFYVLVFLLFAIICMIV